MASLTSGDLQTLRAEFAGAVITPADPAYTDACAAAVWNGDIRRRPALIARCSSAGDVAAALRFARRAGLELTVRGGGHNFAGFAVCDDGLMLDLGALRQVAVDPAGRRAVCGGGATWGDVDAATQAHGLAVPGGFVSTTGIGGLTLGGGIGWLSRKHGLTADNLLAAEVVTADGRLLRASAEEHADLFWALRGGGGNFGVVTSFEYRLHPVGPQVHLGLFFWGADQGAAALRFCRDFLQRVPEEMGAFLAGISAPSEPFVPEPYHHASGYALLIVGFGSAEDHARVVAPIRETVPPAFELVTPMPYTGLQQLFDASCPWGIQAYEKALYLDALSDEVIAVFSTHLPQKRSPLSQVPVFAMGGAYRRVGEAETAFGGSRAAGFVFNIAAFCPTPELLVADRAWVRAFWSALLPFASNAGGYVNYMAEYEEDRVRAAYGAAKYERLARIKARYDPENLFHFNANIKPALQPA
jgi:FAD/FMN-containing dehydrogenase